MPQHIPTKENSMSIFKHGLIAIPLTLAALAVVPAADNGVNPNPPRVNPPGATPHQEGTNTGMTRATNTVDPVNGRMVDHSVKTLTLSSTGHAVTAGSASTVVIGFSEKSSRDLVEKAQGKEKEMYITAAQQNRVVQDGRISDGNNMDRDGKMDQEGKMDHDGKKMDRDGKTDHDGKKMDRDDKNPNQREVDPAQPTGIQTGEGVNDPAKKPLPTR